MTAAGLDTLYVVYAALGSFVVFFGLTSLFVKERLYLTESLAATVFGAALGPHGARVFVPQTWWGAGPHAPRLGEDLYTVLREAARIVISMQVMAAGISTPGGFLRRHSLSVFMMLGPVMVVMWAVSGAAMHFVLDMAWPHAMVAAACVTPTDPVLAMSVIKGKFAERYIPTRLRNLLAVESGANDGLGFPFMMLPILLLRHGMAWGPALAEWALSTWLKDIFGSVVLGVVFGFTARTLLIQSIRRKLIDKESFLVFSLALALVVTGVGALLQCDDLLAVFVAGNAFAWDGDAFMDKADESHIHGVIDLVFNITFFVLFGASVPWASFLPAKTRLVRLCVCAGLILLFRRLPGVLAMQRLIPALQTRKEAFFAGWFGPMGVGAVFFAIEARHKLLAISGQAAFAEEIYPTVAFVVLSSIAIHGITVPLTNSSLKRRMRIKAMRATKNADALLSIIERSAALPRDEKAPEALASDQTFQSDATFASGEATPPSSPSEEYIYVTDDEDDGTPAPRKRRVLVLARDDLESRGVCVPPPADNVILVSAVSPSSAAASAETLDAQSHV